MPRPGFRPPGTCPVSSVTRTGSGIGSRPSPGIAHSAVPTPALLAEQPDTGDTATTALDALSTRNAIAMIASLPCDQAEAVLLRAVVGLDARTAGEVLGKRAGTVRVAAHRGLERLAKQLHHAQRAPDGSDG